MFEPRRVEHFSVDSSWLRKSKELRLDASFYNPRVAHAIATLRKSGFSIKTLGEVTARIFLPPRFKRVYVDKEHGLPFLQGSHVIQFQPADVKYLSRSVHKNLDALTIKPGWLLVTRSGTVGRVAMVPEDWDGWVGSDHIIRVIPDPEECPPGYLYAFLNSPIGHVQLTAQVYGAVVDELTEEQTMSVLVPLPKTPEQQRQVDAINTMTLQAVKKRSEASMSVAKATDSISSMLPRGEPYMTETISATQRLAVNAPGPRPETLKIEGDWQDAVKQSLGKKKPAGGWPK